MRTLLIAAALLVACDEKTDIKKENAMKAHLLNLAQCVCSNKGGVQISEGDLVYLKFLCRDDSTAHARYVTPEMVCYP